MNATASGRFMRRRIAYLVTRDYRTERWCRRVIATPPSSSSTQSLSLSLTTADAGTILTYLAMKIFGNRGYLDARTI